MSCFKRGAERDVQQGARCWRETPAREKCGRRAAACRCPSPHSGDTDQCGFSGRPWPQVTSWLVRVQSGAAQACYQGFCDLSSVTKGDTRFFFKASARLQRRQSHAVPTATGRMAASADDSLSGVLNNRSRVLVPVGANAPEYFMGTVPCTASPGNRSTSFEPTASTVRRSRCPSQADTSTG